jgi:hypothetical protein
MHNAWDASDSAVALFRCTYALSLKDQDWVQRGCGQQKFVARSQ